jgi:hypothetical protein
MPRILRNTFIFILSVLFGMHIGVKAIIVAMHESAKSGDYLELDDSCFIIEEVDVDALTREPL